MSHMTGPDGATVRVHVEQEFLDHMRATLGMTSTTDLARLAFTLLGWAATQRAEGRVILSSDPSGADVRRLRLPGVT